jgi:hypothetical protein
MSEEERENREQMDTDEEKKQVLLDILTERSERQTLEAGDISAMTVQFRLPASQLVGGSTNVILRDPDRTDAIRIGDGDYAGKDRTRMKFDVKGDGDQIIYYP